ncbi:MAG: hypothetical protein U0R27_01845 [Candidatus Nanopelagicales bacterium]|nr:hypothetical protein [Actinomycetota bacterium]MCB0920970.1 hypothetical protein [Actinomycetota bacterium]
MPAHPEPLVVVGNSVPDIYLTCRAGWSRPSGPTPDVDEVGQVARPGGTAAVA